MQEEKYRTLRVGYSFWLVPEEKFQITNRVANKAVENYLYPKGGGNLREPKLD